MIFCTQCDEEQAVCDNCVSFNFPQRLCEDAASPHAGDCEPHFEICDEFVCRLAGKKQENHE